MENKSSILHYYETSKYRRKAISIQVTSGRRFYAVGLIDEGIGTDERQFDSMRKWKKLLKGNGTVNLLLNPYRTP